MLEREAGRRSEFADESCKCGGSLPCVASELVHLIRGRFDQKQAARVLGLHDPGFEHVAVGRANRINSQAFTVSVRLKKGSKPLGGGVRADLCVPTHLGVVSALPILSL